MLLRTAAFLALASTATTQIEVYSNGPVQSHPSGGPGGAPQSQVQNVTPPIHFSPGFSGQQSGDAVIDNFAVGSILLIDEIEVFGFQPGQSFQMAVGEFELALWDGDPSRGSPNQLIAGAGLGTNLVNAPGFVVSTTPLGIYRTQESSPTTTGTEIHSFRVRLPTQLTLLSGNYWLGWRVTPMLGNPLILHAPLTTPGVQVTGDAMLLVSGVYQPIDGEVFGPTVWGQGMPFKFYGINPTAPGGITSHGGGCGSAQLTVAGAPVPGGYLHAKLDNASGLAAILIAATGPTASIPGCSCQLVGTVFASIAATQADLSLELDASLFGLGVFLQGVQANAGAACPQPIVFDLTNAYEFRL